MIYVFLISFLAAIWLPAAAEDGYIGSWGYWVSACIVIIWIIVPKVAEFLNKKMSASAPTENRQIYEKTHKKIVA